ncbi:MAG TPA: thioredoxin domain-containing protein, partial [Roseivirga sp.]
MKKALLITALLFVGIGAFAQSRFVEGQHYDVVSEKKSDQPNVTEFFSLFCGHCFQFEPFMDSLKNTLPKGVPFKKSHVDYIPRDNKPV